ncbi:MAG: hypothetical protein GY856_29935, partial [bacterium]|nr:hypothetical protein [bacterium]
NTNHHVLLERIESRDQVDLDMVLEWTDHEATDRQGRTPGRELAEALEQKGYRPVTRTAPGGSGWGSWREGIDRVLEALFPLAASDERD